MKERPLLCFCLAIFAVSLFVPVFFMDKKSQALAETNEVAVNAIATIKPTAAPTPLQNNVNSTNNPVENVLTTIQSAVNLIATAFVVLLGAFITWLLIMQYRRYLRSSNLIIDNFTNAAGDDNLDKVMKGLKQLTREKIVQVLEKVLQIVRENQKPLEVELYRPPRNFEVPADSDPLLSNLLKSLSEAASGEIKVVVQLLSLVTQPRGTKVMSTLQRKGDSPGILGISFEVTDLQGKQDPMLYTIWEPSNSSVVTTDDSEAQKTQVNVNQQKPSDENKDALALYTLGRLYEEGGALDDAKGQYIDSLKKKPTYEEAQVALKRVYQSKQTLGQRYITLLEPAVHWLALELIKRSMVAVETNINEESERLKYRARVCNFFGAFYQAGALSFDQYPFFYELAIKKFNQAIELDKDWYQPYENLAGTYTNQGSVTSGNTGIRLHYLSLIYYDAALLRLQKYNPPTASLDESTINEIDQKQKEWESRQIKWRILVGKATSQMLTMNEGLQSKAYKVIQDIEADWISAEVSAKIKDSNLLYNIASWYAISVGKIDVLNAKEKARRYLMYSLARDKDQWYGAKIDPTLKSIRSSDDMDNLTFVLLRKLQEQPKLSDSTDESFIAAMDEVWREVKWSTY